MCKGMCGWARAPAGVPAQSIIALHMTWPMWTNFKYLSESDSYLSKSTCVRATEPRGAMDASPSLWGHDPAIYTSGSSRSHINLVGRSLAECTQSLTSSFVDTQERFPGGCHVGKLCRLFANNEPPTKIQNLLLKIYY